MKRLTLLFTFILFFTLKINTFAYSPEVISFRALNQEKLNGLFYYSSESSTQTKDFKTIISWMNSNKPDWSTDYYYIISLGQKISSSTTIFYQVFLLPKNLDPIFYVSSNYDIDDSELNRNLDSSILISHFTDMNNENWNPIDTTGIIRYRFASTPTYPPNIYTDSVNGLLVYKNSTTLLPINYFDTNNVNTTPGATKYTNIPIYYNYLEPVNYETQNSTFINGEIIFVENNWIKFDNIQVPETLTDTFYEELSEEPVDESKIDPTKPNDILVNEYINSFDFKGFSDDLKNVTIQLSDSLKDMFNNITLVIEYLINSLNVISTNVTSNLAIISIFNTAFNVLPESLRSLIVFSFAGTFSLIMIRRI